MFYDEEVLLEAVNMLMEDYDLDEDEAIDLVMEAYEEELYLEEEEKEARVTFNTGNKRIDDKIETIANDKDKILDRAKNDKKLKKIDRQQEKHNKRTEKIAKMGEKVAKKMPNEKMGVKVLSKSKSLADAHAVHGLKKATKKRNIATERAKANTQIATIFKVLLVSMPIVTICSKKVSILKLPHT